jgi:hypothetical protein
MYTLMTRATTGSVTNTETTRSERKEGRDEGPGAYEIVGDCGRAGDLP